MELYGQNGGSYQPGRAPPAGQGTTNTGPGFEEPLQKLSTWEREQYPERPGAPTCAYYMRTGFCGFGSRCRYHHPLDRGLVNGSVGLGGRGEYPERAGVPSCQYYLRTGTCKFGAYCKFHHPKGEGGSSNTVKLNVYGYPLRPEEKECAYYLKTNFCKFGGACKFHHPHPPGTACPLYPTVQTLSVPSSDLNRGQSMTYRVVRSPLPPASYVPGGYGPVLLHPGISSIPNWSSYSGQVSPGVQSSNGAASPFGVAQLATSTSAYSGTYPLVPSSSLTSSGIHKEKKFPERPGVPACQYYVKTGDCKFGSSCRYHHPPEILASLTTCALSPFGLPLRPGLPLCTFYMQKGSCKFGRMCRFDHPVKTPLIDTPIAPYMVNTYPGTLVSTISVPDLQTDLATEFFQVSPGRSFYSHRYTTDVVDMFSDPHPISPPVSKILRPGRSSLNTRRHRREDG